MNDKVMRDGNGDIVTPQQLEDNAYLYLANGDVVTRAELKKMNEAGEENNRLETWLGLAFLAFLIWAALHAH